MQLSSHIFAARFQKNKSSEAASSQPPQQAPQQQPAAASAASASAPEKASTSSGAAVAAATEETDAEKQQSKADVNDRVERWEWLRDYDGGFTPVQSYNLGVFSTPKFSAYEHAFPPPPPPPPKDH